VAATSARNAWAVGLARGRTLIVHWNGSRWRRVSSPDPGGPGSQLLSVTARTTGDAWASGTTAGSKTLLAHWNGHAWKLVRAPSPGGSAILSGVAMRSASDAWEVGEGGGEKTVALHWSGSAWRHVATPSPYDPLTREGSFLDSVAIVSARSAWAVGGIMATNKTLILHWNGTSWNQLASPSPRCDIQLDGVAAASATSAWAVGGSLCHSQPRTLIEHWNGTRWS
jgi:hypothetical protein